MAKVQRHVKVESCPVEQNEKPAGLTSMAVEKASAALAVAAKKASVARD